MSIRVYIYVCMNICLYIYIYILWIWMDFKEQHFWHIILKFWACCSSWSNSSSDLTIAVDLLQVSSSKTHLQPFVLPTSSTALNLLWHQQHTLSAMTTETLGTLVLPKIQLGFRIFTAFQYLPSSSNVYLTIQSYTTISFRSIKNNATQKSVNLVIYDTNINKSVNP